MRAAVVEDFKAAPRFAEFAEPEASEGELLLTVKAAALSNLVRAQASGKHYSSGDTLPLVPGNDGVGVTPEGRRVYFLGPRAPFGSMAERTAVASRMTIDVPESIDDVSAAALGNPALSSWGSLLGRARLERGEVVLVNGATGVSGGQAIQAAKRLGASRVIVTGRDTGRLEALRTMGADEVISLSQPEEALSEAFRAALRGGGSRAGVNVVMDYLWGRSAELLLAAATGQGSMEGEPRIRYVQIGSISGDPISLRSGSLRSSGVELLGSGLGSLSGEAILDSLRRMFEAAAEGGITIETEAVPLAEVESAWTRQTGDRRLVFVP